MRLRVINSVLLNFNTYSLQNSTNSKVFVSFSSPEEKVGEKDQNGGRRGAKRYSICFLLVYARVCVCVLVFIVVLRLRLTLLSAAAAFLMACYNRSRKERFIFVEKKQTQHLN
uniref:(northern house mosquito) hypothetical protein n=1 Tax=Culex pipiens TaxID=7175 RepID=A0A8D8ALN4_CULPI